MAHEGTKVNYKTILTVRPHHASRACHITACTTQLSVLQQLFTLLRYVFLELDSFCRAVNEVHRQGTEHFGSHAIMISTGAAALHTMPGHRLPSAMSVAAAGDVEEQRVMVSRIATHSSCGGCTVHVVSYALAAKLCTELLVTLLLC